MKIFKVIFIFLGCIFLVSIIGLGIALNNPIYKEKIFNFFNITEKSENEENLKIIDTLNIEIQETIENKNKLEIQLQSATNNIETLQEELNTITNTYNQLVEEYESLSNTNLSDENQRLMAQITELENEKNNLQEQINSLNIEMKELYNSLAEINLEQENLNTYIRILEENANASQITIDSLNNDIRNFSNDNQRLYDEAVEHINKINSLNNQIFNLNSNVAMYQSRCYQYEREINEYMCQLDEYKREIEELHNLTGQTNVEQILFNSLEIDNAHIAIYNELDELVFYTYNRTVPLVELLNINFETLRVKELSTQCSIVRFIPDDFELNMSGRVNIRPETTRVCEFLQDPDGIYMPFTNENIQRLINMGYTETTYNIYGFSYQNGELYFHMNFGDFR